MPSTTQKTALIPLNAIQTPESSLSTRSVIGWQAWSIQMLSCSGSMALLGLARPPSHERSQSSLLSMDFSLPVSSSDPKCNTMKPLVANITYSIAYAIPVTHDFINTAMEADPLILDYSIEVQLTKLVFKSLRLLVDQGYFINQQLPQLVIIDGLDKCLDTDTQTNFIQFFSSSVAQYKLPLKFLIVSCPEAYIKSSVALVSEQSTMSHLELNDDFLPDENTRCFLTDRFHEIKRCHPFCSGILSSWPSK